MASLLPLAIGAAVFAMLFFFWMAWWRVSDWRPAVATLRWSDYGDQEQADDRAPFGLARHWSWSDSDRRTDMEVVYRDASGTERHANIVRYIRRGSILDQAFPIWYLKAKPDKASPTGPLPFLFFGLMSGAAAFAMIHTGLHPA
jgi:hypothetical protein